MAAYLMPMHLSANRKSSYQNTVESRNNDQATSFLLLLTDPNIKKMDIQTTPIDQSMKKAISIHAAA
jgi:hypothetical protein